MTMSASAFEYCSRFKADLVKKITDPYWAYKYCKDISEMRKYITESAAAWYYCKNVKNRPEVRKNITNSQCVKI